MILPKDFKPKFKTQLIRLGNLYDGGYVISEKALSETDTLLGFGLNDDWSFEESFRKYNKNTQIIGWFLFSHNFISKSVISFLSISVNSKLSLKSLYL